MLMQLTNNCNFNQTFEEKETFVFYVLLLLHTVAQPVL